MPGGTDPAEGAGGREGGAVGPVRNTLRSQAVVRALLRHGIMRAVLCPGGRAASLVLALAGAEGLASRVMNDERAAAFFALGWARGTGWPVAICTTSGSAVANLLPALLEAEALAIPLLVLACDRPEAERGGGGPQSSDHAALCRPVMRRMLLLGDPAGRDEGARLDRFLTDWRGPRHVPGPALINLPYLGRVSALDPEPDGPEAAPGARTTQSAADGADPAPATPATRAMPEAAGKPETARGEPIDPLPDGADPAGEIVETSAAPGLATPPGSPPQSDAEPASPDTGDQMPGDPENAGQVTGEAAASGALGPMPLRSAVPDDPEVSRQPPEPHRHEGPISGGGEEQVHAAPAGAASPAPRGLSAPSSKPADKETLSGPKPSTGPIGPSTEEPVAPVGVTPARVEMFGRHGQGGGSGVEWVVPEGVTPSRAEVFGRLPTGPGLAGLIVVGSDCPLPSASVRAFAAATGFPVIADAGSGLRGPEHCPQLIAGADLLTSTSLGRGAEAGLVVQIGKAPAYHGLHRFLERQTCPLLLIDRAAPVSDFLGRAFLSLGLTGPDPLPVLADRLGRGDPAWAARWTGAEAALQQTLDTALEDLPWGEVPAAAAICRAEGVDLLHLGNSMPLRLGNLFCAPAAPTATPAHGPRRILTNRGVNGIDGTLSCFLGEMSEAEGPGLLLLGDLAFLHDLGALDLVRESGARGAICVVQNGGGAIFDFLPGQEAPCFAEAIRNPRPCPLPGLAAAFGLPYHRADSRGTLAAALAQARAADCLHLIDIVVPPHSAREGLQMLYLSLLFR
ncbi:MAG: thiamine pyrophosphate-binding protein [Pseudomonadota bacterium]